jgi:hypothetical protein
METQMGRSINMLMVVGALLALMGIAALAIPVFTTEQTKDIAHVGDLKLQTQESTSHAVPTIISGSALVLGLVLLGAGFFRRR